MTAMIHSSIEKSNIPYRNAIAFVNTSLHFINCVSFYRNTETLIHLLKGSLGTGILAMPQAIYHAGYIIGSIGTVAIGLLCVYNMQMLLQAHYELCKRKRVSKLLQFIQISKNK